MSWEKRVRLSDLDPAQAAELRQQIEVAKGTTALATQGGTEPKTSLCCFCNQLFPSKGALKQHKRAEHLEKIILASRPHITEQQEWKKFLHPSLWHPAADLMPMCDGEEFKRLVTDIRENGLQVPVVLFQDRVLDGRNRLRACAEANVKPIFISLDADEKFNPVSWVLSTNLSRRHLTKSQVACILVDAEELIGRLRTEAKARQAHAVSSLAATEEVMELIPEASPAGTVRDKLGELGGVSGRYVGEAAALKTKAPELFQKVKSGAPGAPSLAACIKHLHGGSPTTGPAVYELKTAFNPAASKSFNPYTLQGSLFLKTDRLLPIAISHLVEGADPTERVFPQMIEAAIAHMPPTFEVACRTYGNVYQNRPEELKNGKIVQERTAAELANLFDAVAAYLTESARRIRAATK